MRRGGEAIHVRVPDGAAQRRHHVVLRFVIGAVLADRVLRIGRRLRPGRGVRGDARAARRLHRRAARRRRAVRVDLPRPSAHVPLHRLACLLHVPEWNQHPGGRLACRSAAPTPQRGGGRARSPEFQAPRSQAGRRCPAQHHRRFSDPDVVRRPGDPDRPSRIARGRRRVARSRRGGHPRPVHPGGDLPRPGGGSCWRSWTAVRSPDQ